VINTDTKEGAKNTMWRAFTVFSDSPKSTPGRMGVERLWARWCPAVEFREDYSDQISDVMAQSSVERRTRFAPARNSVSGYDTPRSWDFRVQSGETDRRYQVTRESK